MKKSLSFDDVLLEPKYSDIESRVQKKKIIFHNPLKKISFNRINVFVANKEEKKLYDKSLEGIIPKNQIIIGVHKIGAQRNFIEQYYKKNTLLIMIDDDIDGVFSLSHFMVQNK